VTGEFVAGIGLRGCTFSLRYVAEIERTKGLQLADLGAAVLRPYMSVPGERASKQGGQCATIGIGIESNGPNGAEKLTPPH